jgi:hypothetical protein
MTILSCQYNSGEDLVHYRIAKTRMESRFERDSSRGVPADSC